MSVKLIDRVVAGGLTLILHLLIVIVALMPPGNYFFPFFSGFGRRIVHHLTTGPHSRLELLRTVMDIQTRKKDRRIRIQRFPTSGSRWYLQDQLHPHHAGLGEER